MFYILSWWTDEVVPGLYRLSLSIDAIFYRFIDYIYKLILVLSDANILNGVSINELIERIYNIVGVIMLFVLAYSLLTSLVNPDNLMKGKQNPKKILGNLVLTLVLIEVIPVLFSFAFELQSALLENNTIGKIILGGSGIIKDESGSDVDPNKVINEGGVTVSTSLFSAFFHPHLEYCQSYEQEDNAIMGLENCQILLFTKNGAEFDITKGSIKEIANDKSKIVDVRKDLKTQGSLTYGEIFNVFVEDDNGNVDFFKPLANQIGDDKYFTYTYIVSLIAAITILVVLLKYCIDLAVRSVKLAFLQIVAPIPILARLMPEGSAKNMFGKWVKMTMSIFFEVFIRLGVIFFVVFIVKAITIAFNSTNFNNIFNDSSYITPSIRSITLVFLIIGLFMFMFQAPKLISELTGIDSSKMSLGPSALLGGLTGFVGGAIASKRNGGKFWAGGFSGAVDGYRGKGNQWMAQANKQYQALTGDKKGKAGIFGKKSLGSKFNEYVSNVQGNNLKYAGDNRENRINELSEAKRRQEAYQNGSTVLSERMTKFEGSKEFSDAEKRAKSSEFAESLTKELARIMKAWEGANPYATESERRKQSNAILAELHRAKTIELLKADNRGYKKEHTDVAHYLRDVDTKAQLEKMLTMTPKAGEEYISKLRSDIAEQVSKLGSAVAKDNMVAASLDKAAESKHISDALNDLMKKNGIDLSKTGNKDDKKGK